jgi:inner membrane protein
MDNVTHALAGLLLAESAGRLRARRARPSEAEPPPRLRAVAAIASMVAANLPDADLFYTGAGADRLAYMLHHRGYTHTVVLALLGAALVWGAAWGAVRWRAPTAPARGDAGWLLGLLVASTLSHLVLDWTNSYGVHPFWPVDTRWRYGDAVFIVEPWLWVVSVPALVAATTRRRRAGSWRSCSWPGSRSRGAWTSCRPARRPPSPPARRWPSGSPACSAPAPAPRPRSRAGWRSRW